jgi:hypothetical protein
MLKSEKAINLHDLVHFYVYLYVHVHVRFLEHVHVYFHVHIHVYVLVHEENDLVHMEHESNITSIVHDE